MGRFETLGALTVPAVKEHIGKINKLIVRKGEISPQEEVALNLFSGDLSIITESLTKVNLGKDSKKKESTVVISFIVGTKGLRYLKTQNLIIATRAVGSRAFEKSEIDILNFNNIDAINAGKEEISKKNPVELRSHCFGDCKLGTVVLNEWVKARSSSFIKAKIDNLFVAGTNIHGRAFKEAQIKYIKFEAPVDGSRTVLEAGRFELERPDTEKTVIVVDDPNLVIKCGAFCPYVNSFRVQLPHSIDVHLRSFKKIENEAFSESSSWNVFFFKDGVRVPYPC